MPLPYLGIGIGVHFSIGAALEVSLLKCNIKIKLLTFQAPTAPASQKVVFFLRQKQKSKTNTAYQQRKYLYLYSPHSTSLSINLSPFHLHKSPSSIVRLCSAHAHTPIMTEPNRQRSKNWKKKALEKLHNTKYLQQITQFLIPLPLVWRQCRLHPSKHKNVATTLWQYRFYVVKILWSNVVNIF